MAEIETNSERKFYNSDGVEFSKFFENETVVMGRSPAGEFLVFPRSRVFNEKPKDESPLDRWFRETGIDFEQKAKTAPRKGSRPTMKLAENGKTCKDCKHAVRRDGGSRYFHKCLLMQKVWTCGAATDIRLRDPACAFFEDEE